MVKEDGKQEHQASSPQVEALQDQLGNVLSGVERSLAVACESIMDKMKQLEDKIQDMENRYSDLAKDAESALKKTTDKPDSSNSDDAPVSDDKTVS